MYHLQNILFKDLLILSLIFFLFYIYVSKKYKKNKAQRPVLDVTRFCTKNKLSTQFDNHCIYQYEYLNTTHFIIHDK